MIQPTKGFRRGILWLSNVYCNYALVEHGAGAEGIVRTGTLGKGSIIIRCETAAISTITSIKSFFNSNIHDLDFGCFVFFHYF